MMEIATRRGARSRTAGGRDRFGRPGRQDDDPNAWHVTFTPYLWAAGLYGDVTVRGVDATLDASFVDLLEATDTLVGLQGHAWR